MLQLEDIEASFQQQDLKKFKEQINSFPKGSNLAVGGDETCNDQWNIFISKLCEGGKKNYEYIEVLKNAPDDTLGRTVRTIDQLINIGFNLYKQIGNEIVNMPVNELRKDTINLSLDLSGQDRKCVLLGLNILMNTVSNHLLIS